MLQLKQLKKRNKNIKINNNAILCIPNFEMSVAI